MNYKVHFQGGVLFGTVAADILTVTNNASYAPYTLILMPFIGGFGATLPDLDKAGTHASNRMPHLSLLIQKLGHRKLSHSLIIPAIGIIIGLILSAMILPISKIIASFIFQVIFSLFMGYISHICYDFITTMGVPLIAPFSKETYSVGFMKNDADANKMTLFTVLMLLPMLYLLLHFLYIIVLT